MREWIWRDGRFAWPIVVAILYVAMFLLLSDYVWRTVGLPFEALAMILLITFAIGAGALVMATQLLRGRRG